MPIITTLPQAPNRSMDAGTFITTSDAFVASLAQFVSELNAYGIYITASRAYSDVVTVSSASYAITILNTIYICDTTATSISITFPTAVGYKGQCIYLENTGTTSNLLTVTPYGAETIEGAATLELDCGMGRTIYSNGANWRIMKT